MLSVVPYTFYCPECGAPVRTITEKPDYDYPEIVCDGCGSGWTSIEMYLSGHKPDFISEVPARGNGTCRESLSI